MAEPVPGTRSWRAISLPFDAGSWTLLAEHTSPGDKLGYSSLTDRTGQCPATPETACARRQAVITGSARMFVVRRVYASHPFLRLAFNHLLVKSQNVSWMGMLQHGLP